jgi:hypothetical protein
LNLLENILLQNSHSVGCLDFQLAPLLVGELHLPARPNMALDLLGTRHCRGPLRATPFDDAADGGSGMLLAAEAAAVAAAEMAAATAISAVRLSSLAADRCCDMDMDAANGDGDSTAAPPNSRCTE